MFAQKLSEVYKTYHFSESLSYRVTCRNPNPVKTTNVWVLFFSSTIIIQMHEDLYKFNIDSELQYQYISRLKQIKTQFKKHAR